jgi:hypothetical protein
MIGFNSNHGGKQLFVTLALIEYDSVPILLPPEHITIQNYIWINRSYKRGEKAYDRH